GNVGASVLTNVVAVVQDSTNATPPFNQPATATNVTAYVQYQWYTNSGLTWNGIDAVSVGTYTQANLFLPGSTHTASIIWVDNYNQTNFGTLQFIVPQYVPFTNTPYSISAVDTSKVGFGVRPYQSMQA